MIKWKLPPSTTCFYCALRDGNSSARVLFCLAAQSRTALFLELGWTWWDSCTCSGLLSRMKKTAEHWHWAKFASKASLFFHPSSLNGCWQNKAVSNQEPTSSMSLITRTGGSAIPLILSPHCHYGGQQPWCYSERTSKASKLLSPMNLVFLVSVPLLISLPFIL